MVNPKLLILLVAVIAFVLFQTLTNPHKKYSTQKYWESATLADVNDIPDEAIQVGNKNGPVLMWAATTVQDPEILKALVSKGSEINEVDGIFMGTPLSAAAAYNPNTEIIDTLIALGADIKIRLFDQNSILINAAMYNTHPGIIENLLAHGADPSYRNGRGQNALELAQMMDNQVAVEALQAQINP